MYYVGHVSAASQELGGTGCQWMWPTFWGQMRQSWIFNFQVILYEALKLGLMY